MNLKPKINLHCLFQTILCPQTKRLQSSLVMIIHISSCSSLQESQPTQINVHLRAVLHEDEHLLPVDLHPEVVDQVGVVDRLKDP